MDMITFGKGIRPNTTIKIFDDDNTIRIYSSSNMINVELYSLNIEFNIYSNWKKYNEFKTMINNEIWLDIYNFCLLNIPSTKLIKIIKNVQSKSYNDGFEDGENSIKYKFRKLLDINGE